jgi:hypothetical protein
VSSFLYKLLIPCLECGESLTPGGPRRLVECAACRSSLELSAERWRAILGFRQFAAEFQLADGRTRGSALSDGELRIHVRWGPSRPACTACAAPLLIDTVPPGADGELRCGCGQSVATFPAPGWLREVVPSAAQMFGAEREAGPEPAALVVEPRAGRPVAFACLTCGAALTIAAETPRISSCRYCDSDFYLPDPLWRALHPVRRRSGFWVTFAE